MIRQKRHIFFWISGIAFLLVSGLFYYTQAEQGKVSLEITGIGIRHGTPSNFNLGPIIASPSEDQRISGQFIEPFWVEDSEGYITGHYTTIQCDGIYNTTYNYRLTDIYLKAGNITPELLMGLTGNHVFINPLLSGYTNILTPVTYIYKETHNDNLGLVNRYGDKPRFKILIPTTAPRGSYSGTIVFSFYME